MLDLREDARLPAVHRLGIIAGTCLVGAIWLAWKGPVPVLRGTTPLPEITPFWYMESAFIALGILLCDLIEEGRAGWSRREAIQIAGQIILLVAMSSLRLDARIPLSGHAALFAFLVFQRLLLGSIRYSPIGRLETVVGAALLMIVSYIKVVWWHDLLSLSTGLLVGIVISLTGVAMNTVFRKKM